MAEQYKVTFTPEDRTVTVDAGATILEAGNEAGVYVNSLCGGDGVCGKCRVIVQSGQVRSAPTEFLTPEEIRKGYVLACQSRVESDLLVEVPEESQIRQVVEPVEAANDQAGEAPPQERYDVALCPLVRKHYVQPTPPSLDNNLADLERLIFALTKQVGAGDYQMGLKVTQQMPRALRDGDWKVTATTAVRGPLTEILNVEVGDTTGRSLGVAVDVGTTTVVVHLLDLTTGRTLGTATRYNSQIRYGGDVIRRIMYATKTGRSLRDLQDAVVGDVNDLARRLLDAHHLASQDVTMITAAGNTTMMHLLAGITPEWIRREPFVGVAYRPPPFRAAEIGLEINPRALLYCLPSVASFVGADITAGVLATGLHRSDEVRMLLDIGTNGEVAIGNKDFIVCASTSAGPAFEGAESEAGMRATRGAIYNVQPIEANRPPVYKTIGDAPPIGICGTGYIDLLAELLSAGLMDKTGRLQPEACERIRSDEQDVNEYAVARASESGGDRDVVITQEDIANLVRAKGAVYAGTCVMLNSLSMTFDDVTEIMVAGAFGSSLDLSNAIMIGLLPDVPLKRLRFVGNTSMTGAKLATLSREKYAEVSEIADNMTYFELGTDPTFMDQFSSACFFPHTDVERFPSVLARLHRSGGEGGGSWAR